MKQAEKLRQRMSAEHGDLFEKLKHHARRLHNAPPAGGDMPIPHSATSAEKVDTQKNMRTVLKFIEDRGSNGNQDLFAKKVFELIRDKTSK